MNGDEETPLFRDRDGSILLMRLPGDAWTVCKCQSDADALTGFTKDGVSFLRVVPLSEVREALLGEEAIHAVTEVLDDEAAAEAEGEAVTDYALAKRLLRVVDRAAFASTDSEGQS